MNEILVSQLTLDYCCTESEVLDDKPHFAAIRSIDGQRRFDGDEDCFLKIASAGGKLLCAGRQDIIDELSDRLKALDGRWFMEWGPLARLDSIIGRYGYRIKQVHPFYAAEKKTAVRCDGMDIRWFTENEIKAFEGDDRFDEAFAFAPEAPDVLGVAAYEGEEIAGIAGVSADSPTMWQIGVNVMDSARSKGIGTMLVGLIKNAVLDKGILPYYGTALSHTASQRVAVNAGFLPAWAELITEPSME